MDESPNFSKIISPVIIIALIAVLLIIFGGAYLFLQTKSSKKGEENTQKSSHIASQESRQPSPSWSPLVTPPPNSEMPYETYKTPDGKLVFAYPKAWIQTEIKNLETVLPKEYIQKYNLSIPLILSDPKGGRMSLSVYSFAKGIDLNSAMNTLEKDSATLGAPYSEISRQSPNTNSLIVTSTITSRSAKMKLRETLFLVPGDLKNSVYLVSFASLDTIWGDYETIFNHVQESLKLTL